MIFVIMGVSGSGKTTVGTELATKCKQDGACKGTLNGVAHMQTGSDGEGSHLSRVEVIRLLKKQLQWPFADADDFHSEANKKKMENGCCLNDQDRLPWLISLHEQIHRWSLNGHNGLLFCSALKQFYRHILVTGSTNGFNRDKPPTRNERDAEEQFQLTEHIEPIDNSQLFTGGVCCHDVEVSVVFIFLQVSEEILSERMNRRTGHFMPSSLLRSQLDTLEEPKLPEQFITVDADRSVSEVLEDCLIKIESCFKATNF